MEPYCYVPVAEFADRFRKFHVGVATAEALAVPYPRADASNKATEGQEAVRFPLLNPPLRTLWTHGGVHQFGACK